MTQRLTGVWLPVAVLVLALIPRGAPFPVARNAVMLVVAVAFLALAARLVLTHGKQGAFHAARSVWEGVNPALLLALPMLVAVQVVLQLTIGFSDGPTFAIVQSWMLLTVMAAFYLLTNAAVRDHGALKALIASLVVIVSLEALYGVLNLLAGNEHILFLYPRRLYQTSATGTLISRNDFAMLMEMALPLAAATSALLTAGPADGRAPEESEQRARKLMLGTAAVAMGLGLLFSKSRMGLFSFVVAVASVVTINRYVQPAESSRERRRRRGRKLPVAPLVVTVVVLGYGAVIGLEPLLERMLQLPENIESGRREIWQTTLAMIAERPVFGHGWGSYQGLLPAYWPRPSGFYFTHAHNEYLEVLAETGVIGLGLVGWMLFLFGRRLVTTLAMPLSPTQRATIVALGVAVTSILLHSTADFGLRIPGVAFTFLCVLVMFVRATADPQLVDPAFDPDAWRAQRRRRRSSRER